MLLNVENVTTAKTGKSLRVKANGDWYGAKKDSGITAGMAIDAEIEDGDYGKWIKAYKANAAPQEAATSASRREGPSAPPAGAAPIWANFVSNQVAHAIQAGLITDPGQVKLWAAAAKQAFEELTK